MDSTARIMHYKLDYCVQQTEWVYKKTHVSTYILSWTRADLVDGQDGGRHADLLDMDPQCTVYVLTSSTHSIRGGWKSNIN